MVTLSNQQQDRVFKALADPTRREILRLLRGGRRTVGGLAATFRTNRPAISKHLRLLRQAGLVSTRKQGAASMCALNGKPLRAVNEWLQEYQTFWDEKLRNLKKHVEENP